MLWAPLLSLLALAVVECRGRPYLLRCRRPLVRGDESFAGRLVG
jgi:hypothetical protein